MRHVCAGPISAASGKGDPSSSMPTYLMNRAIHRLARTEGLLLDPVYTAKAMAGMLDLLEGDGPVEPVGEVREPLFLHTGGTPALFAYLD